MNYKKELASRVKVGGSLTIEKLETKKRGPSIFSGRRNG